MASTPKRRRLRATLARRAEAAIGLGATPLDYVERWVANGGLITELAASLQSEMGEVHVARVLVAHRVIVWARRRRRASPPPGARVAYAHADRATSVSSVY